MRKKPYKTKVGSLKIIAGVMPSNGIFIRIILMEPYLSKVVG